MCVCYPVRTLHTGCIEMSDQDFRERVLESLLRIEAQAKKKK